MRKLLLMLTLMPLLAQTQEIAKNNSQVTKFQQETNCSTGIQWAENLSWQEIKDKAKAENKFIFIDAYATWCAPCKLMDKEVFPDKAVGEFLNSQFISVKVQMDETDKDNAKVRSWYPDARYINDIYKPEGYPCFLFFSPDATLAHKAIGFHKPENFVALAKEALTNPVEKYESNVAKFKKGQLEVAAMPALARLAQKNKDNDLANTIAKAYKENYLDHLSDEKAFTKENLLFIVDFYYSLLNSKDRFFRFFYYQGDKANGLMNHPFGKVSDWVVTAIIKKEEITDKLYKDGKPITNAKPHWGKINTSITEKYNENYANKYFPNEQISFYRAVGDWKNYVKYINKKIEMFPPKTGGHTFGAQFGDSWDLNIYAWHLFQYCNKEKYLKSGLPWIEKGIQLSAQESKDSLPNIQYLDTKANLLYRLGKKKEAIELEQEAISLLPAESTLRKEYKEVVEKMKQGLPTWPVAEK
jgi:thioredoxin-related protein